MALIDDLVNVKISISSGVANEDSFNDILLIGPAPADYDGDALGVKVYGSLSEIAEIWASTDEVYKAATIIFGNGAARLYVGVTGDGAVTDVLNDALNVSGWYGLAVCGVESTEYETIATWADANSKLFAYTADCSEEIVNPVSDSHMYALGVATKSIEENENNAYIGAGFLSQLLSNYEPGSETWAYKQISSCVADEWTASQISDLKAVVLNYYTPCAGKDITLEGKVTGGEWADVIRFRDWLLSEIQNRVYNLFIKNSKVPYTDAGIALVNNAMLGALRAGQDAGGISPTEFDEDGNEVPGYTTSVPLVSSVSDSDKAARKLTNCKFTARLAGAIHLVEITGTLVE